MTSTLHYKPGKELYSADTLLRAHLPTSDDDDEDLVLCVHMAIANLPVRDKKLAELHQETANDSIMVKLTRIIQEGWPNHKNGVSKDVSEFWAYRDELIAVDGLIFKGESIVVPRTLRESILAQIHEGHLGMEKSKLRARELVFWPGMSKQIEDVVSNCTTCQQLRLSHPKEPMIPHEIPQYPWQIVASDLFEWNGGSYVLVVDYYSRYWEIAVLHSTTSTAVINKLRQIFARHTGDSEIGQWSTVQFC